MEELLGLLNTKSFNEKDFEIIDESDKHKVLMEYFCYGAVLNIQFRNKNFFSHLFGLLQLDNFNNYRKIVELDENDIYELNFCSEGLLLAFELIKEKDLKLFSALDLDDNRVTLAKINDYHFELEI